MYGIRYNDAIAIAGSYLACIEGVLVGGHEGPVKSEKTPNQPTNTGTVRNTYVYIFVHIYLSSYLCSQ
jgi:hypothetical protein